MENKDLVDKLVQHSSETILADEEVVSVSTVRVMSIRYRIYSLLLIALLVLGITNYLLPSYERLQQTFAERISLQNQLSDYTQKKQSYDQDKALLQLISRDESTIISCVNTKQWCKTLDPRIRDNFSFVRSYLELNNLSDETMEINEKLLLASIHGFLLGNMSSGVVLNGISFGDPELLVKQLWSIPVHLNITFPTKESLLAFVDNVDRYVVVDRASRVLYKIDQLSYDITHAQTTQTVDTSLHAFYYK